jgi:hypothetical protein
MRIKTAFKGKKLRDYPTGFPLFYQKKRTPRILTSDIWAFLRHISIKKFSGNKEKEKEALAYIEQAYDFFEAAHTHRISSRPLLFYYSFLNLAKVFLLQKGVNLTPAPKHGISDPRANIRRRVQLEGQKIRIENIANTHTEIFPEFIKALGGNINGPTEMKLMNILAQIPAIHRTYCSLKKQRPLFCPISKIELFKNRNQLVVRLTMDKDDKDVEYTISHIKKKKDFKNYLHAVKSDKKNELWYETNPVSAHGRQVDKAISELCKKIMEIGVWTILTQEGYRFYSGNFNKKESLPQLCSIYAVMFYFGSITRYKPYDFDIITKGYFWLINEYLKTQPMQFLYVLSSILAGTDVVKSYAILEG